MCACPCLEKRILFGIRNQNRRLPFAIWKSRGYVIVGYNPHTQDNTVYKSEEAGVGFDGNWYVVK